MALDSAAATADYCRRARRIRASFSRSPSLRQRALGQLASQRNIETNCLVKRTVASPVSTARGVNRGVDLVVNPASQTNSIAAIELGFAQHAALRLQPFGFTFSDRIDLLNSAQRLGISRFRANMILALHEHRAGSARAAKPIEKSPHFAPSFAAILAVEILVVGLIAWACML